MLYYVFHITPLRLLFAELVYRIFYCFFLAIIVLYNKTTMLTIDTACEHAEPDARFSCRNAIENVRSAECDVLVTIR